MNNTTNTLAFTINTDNVSYYDEKIVVLGDELILNRFCITHTNAIEVFVIDAGDMGIADAWVANGDIMPVRIKQRYITEEEDSMNTHREELEQLLIAYIDSGEIELIVAQALMKSVDLETLEELLISCVDSWTVSEQVAVNILNRLS